jgi:hypothetical protein
VQRDGEALQGELDVLEERLLSNQAKVLLWTELAGRHRKVSEVACSNQTKHLYEMVSHAERQTERMRRARRGRVRMGDPELAGGLGGPVFPAGGRR